MQLHASPVYLGVAQLVACYLGVVEAAGSRPVTQTRENRLISGCSRSQAVFVLDGKIDTTLTTTHTKCSVENKNPAGYFLSVLHISSYFEYI